MNEMCALILVGGRGTRLKSLTIGKTKPYVSFMGKYRIIDFPLSALSHSHIFDVGIITQYEPFELMRYIGSGSTWDLDAFNRGVSFLTPFMTDKEKIEIQKGTAHAVKMQKSYIESIDSKYVLILSGDQIYKIDFRDVLEKHIENNAKLTILTYKHKKKEDLSRFGILTYDDNFKITSFEEKPSEPKSDNISMGIYLFNKDFLLEYVDKYADKLVDFGNDLIPYILKKSNDVYAYPYSGLFFDVGTVESLYEANMYFLDRPGILSPHGDSLKIYSKPFDYYPALIKDGAEVKKSSVSDGSIIYGSINHSIISYKNVIKKGAEVSDSILLPGVVVEEDAKIKRAVINENLRVKKGAKLIFDEPTLVDSSFEEVDTNE